MRKRSECALVGRILAATKEGGSAVVKPAPFDYHAPTSTSEAVELLGRVGTDGKVLAGGQSLMPLLNLRLARPSQLIDINGLQSEIGQIRTDDGGVAIGAMTRQRAAERSVLIAERCPLLAEALPLIGHPQIRNRGTIGGSLAHADPASELPAVMSVLDAQLVARAAHGERVVKVGDFFVGFLTTALEPDELLVEVRIPAWPRGAGWSFQEVSRRHGDFAMVGVATMVLLNPDGTISEARLGYTGVAALPVRARAAERLLGGQHPSADVFAEAAEAGARELDPQDDIHAPAAYRTHVAKVLTSRALHVAVQRARGGAA
jgi:CO/xanthine dehydrogenase FAD-binding subunit